MMNLSGLVSFLMIPAEEVLNTATEVVADAVATVGDAVSDVLPAATPAPSGTSGGPMEMLVTLGFPLLMLVAIWFFMMRPQRKREKQMVEMQESLKVGENVLTSAGFYGKIVSVGHDSFMIEFGADGGGRGVRVPVRKADVVGIKTPVMTPPPVQTAEIADKKGSSK